MPLVAGYPSVHLTESLFWGSHGQQVTGMVSEPQPWSPTTDVGWKSSPAPSRHVTLGKLPCSALCGPIFLCIGCSWPQRVAVSIEWMERQKALRTALCELSACEFSLSPQLSG